MCRQRFNSNRDRRKRGVALQAEQAECLGVVRKPGAFVITRIKISEDGSESRKLREDTAIVSTDWIFNAEAQSLSNNIFMRYVSPNACGAVWEAAPFRTWRRSLLAFLCVRDIDGHDRVFN
jgi:hypothetical protein